MNSILVNDTLWPLVTTTPVQVFTNSPNLFYTIRNLLNNTPYIFRIAAVTQDTARINLVGLIKVIGNRSPYLTRPRIIGKVPARLTNVEYIVGSGNITVKWSSSNINNTEGIIRFVIEYRVFGSGTDYLTQTFEYVNSIVFNNNIDTITFTVTVSGLDTHSYEMVFYSENSVGYTNTIDKINLHDEIQLSDIYENLTLPRLVRPISVPSIITELRE
jgi:hypothetical protein